MPETKTKVTMIVPMPELEKIHAKMMRDRDCESYGCRLMRTDCRLERLRQSLENWWRRTNGQAPGFSCYERMIDSSLNMTDRLYDDLYRNTCTVESLHAFIKDRVKEIFKERRAS